MALQRIALFTEMLDFDESYMDLVWRSSDRQARGLDAHLLVCVGHRLDRLEPELRPHNAVYSLALANDFDAFVLSQTFYQHLEPAQRDELGRLMAGRPAATALMPLAGVPCVRFGNQEPLHRLMRHLIHDHGFRKIVVVTGPMDVAESRERFEVWREELAAAGLEHGDDLVVEAHFHPSYAPGAAAAVAERLRATGAQAVVACSDLMAAALLAGLSELGLRVPGDVALTGFDDIPMARILEPPLTTVRQPVEELFEAVFRRVTGREAPSSVEGRLVIRGSCGCPPGAPGREPVRDGPTAASLAEAHGRIRFLRARVSEANLFGRELHELPGLEQLGGFLAEWLPRLGIGTFLVSLACDARGGPGPIAVDPEGPELVPAVPPLHRVLAVSPSNGLSAGMSYDASGILPGEWLESLPRSTFVVLPLALNGCWYGLAAMEVQAEGNLMCRTVQDLVSAFLDREFRMREMVRKNLEARVGAQIEAEKVQSIGTLIAGVAHDLASPLGVCQTSVSLLQEYFAQVKAALAANQLNKADFLRFLADGEETLGILANGNQRAIDQVASFKRISTEVPRDDLRNVELVGFIRDILKNLQPMWRHTKVRVGLTGDSVLPVVTHTAAFIDILTNLIQNCLVHAWPEGGGGNITIIIHGPGDCQENCSLVLSDDGAGVPEDLIGRIFDPFFTTKEGKGGTGLGLHIVHQRVTGLLGGTVRCESKPGGGTRFVIEFPRVLTA
jgi:signal transduction histidine kinase/DNA-binding LacI/PurR family transcriptional regulator